MLCVCVCGLMQSVKLLAGDFTDKPIYKSAHIFFTEGLILLTNYLYPFPFGRICFVVLVMRKRGESS